MATWQSPTFQALGLCSQELPQWLGAEECSGQDEVEEEEAQPSPGVQSPQHGENHLLLRSWLLASTCPSPNKKMEPTASSQGRLTKGTGSRAQSQHQLWTRPETSSLRFVCHLFDFTDTVGQQVLSHILF